MTEYNAVAPSPECGGPADTMQKAEPAGPPRSRNPASKRTGEGSLAIPYQGTQNANTTPVTS